MRNRFDQGSQKSRKVQPTLQNLQSQGVKREIASTNASSFDSTNVDSTIWCGGTSPLDKNLNIHFQMENKAVPGE